VKFMVDLQFDTEIENSMRFLSSLMLDAKLEKERGKIDMPTSDEASLFIF
jgi:hypothetical protein